MNEEKNGIIIPERQGNGYRIFHNSHFTIHHRRYIFMYKVLISDNIARECIDILEAVSEIEVDLKTKLTPEELKAIIGDYDALVVRSATKVREDIIEAAKKLKVIGRAGSGVDNIDVSKATDAGIVVLNTPGGNTISTAEHAFSLIMALEMDELFYCECRKRAVIQYFKTKMI